jgi:hypothetical protein
MVMRDTPERPVCHRAEDLVSYLYGEAGASDALDFRNHLQQCDACSSEFALFNQVHDSIQLWRHEALGAAFDPAAITEPAIETAPSVRRERKLSALAALREFFTVAPLWLRGATAFAALLLLVLGGLMVARLQREPVTTAIVDVNKQYTQQQMDSEIKKAVDRTREEFEKKPNDSAGTVVQQGTPQIVKRPQMATNQTKIVRPRGLNRQEREQLAADLRITTPADEDDTLLVMPQLDNPNR